MFFIVLADTIDRHFQEGNVYKALILIHEYFMWTNKLIDDHKVWILVKNPESEQHLDCVLHMVFETLRVCVIMLQPIIPNMAARMLDRINVPSRERTIDNTRTHCNDKSRKLGTNTSMLLKRIKT